MWNTTYSSNFSRPASAYKYERPKTSASFGWREHSGDSVEVPFGGRKSSYKENHSDLGLEVLAESRRGNSPRSRAFTAAHVKSELNIARVPLPKIFVDDPAISATHHDFGEFGSVPATRAPQTPQELTESSSTVDLCRGTPRGTRHLPGYRGFVPRDDSNPKAVYQGSGRISRSAEKTSHNLNLGRDLLPGYGGYRPTSPSYERPRSTMTGESEYSEAFVLAPQTRDVLSRTARRNKLYSDALNPWRTSKSGPMC